MADPEEKESGSAAAGDGSKSADRSGSVGAGADKLASANAPTSVGPGTQSKEGLDEGVDAKKPDPWEDLLLETETGAYCFGTPGCHDGVTAAQREGREPTLAEVCLSESPIYVDREYEEHGYM